MNYRYATLAPVSDTGVGSVRSVVGHADLVGVLRLVSSRPLRLMNGDTLGLLDRSTVIGADTQLVSLSSADIIS